MQVYDKLHELTGAVRQSEQYKRYMAAARAVSGNELYESMIRDFLAAQIELSAMKMLGRQPDEDRIDNFNNLYASVSSIGEVNEFIQAQMAFSLMMDDITREIASLTDTGFDFMKFNPGDFVY
ncbi:MAG: YlbF family regulator [Eubacteriaceae bacterium]|nr:YlbF family regulator [Eubacteriaceae bacterium]